MNTTFAVNGTEITMIREGNAIMEIPYKVLPDGSMIVGNRLFGPPLDPNSPGQWSTNGGGGGASRQGTKGSNQEATCGNWRPSYPRVGTPHDAFPDPNEWKQVLARDANAFPFGMVSFKGMPIIGGGFKKLMYKPIKGKKEEKKKDDGDGEKKQKKGRKPRQQQPAEMAQPKGNKGNAKAARH